MNYLRKLVPPSIRTYMNRIQQRLSALESLNARVSELEQTTSSLETTIDTMLESPTYEPGQNLGFNWQSGRKQIFTDLIRSIKFDVVIETGTWIGNTTGYMAEASGLPVISTELTRRFHALAHNRLRHLEGIRLVNADSRHFLQLLAADEKLKDAFPFIYLDAHWYTDLPLNEEIDLIAATWKRFVVMIDDFKVPGDDGYGYDDYGPGKVLSLEYIGPRLLQYGLAVFFPSIQSNAETGLRRGCVVLAPHGMIADEITRVPSLTVFAE
jgi:predicted O-methyltransferase YrrM